MKHGHPSRKHEWGKPRSKMESAGHHMKRGTEHLHEHHKEERREIDHGHNHERGMSRKERT